MEEQIQTIFSCFLFLKTSSADLQTSFSETLIMLVLFYEVHSFFKLIKFQIYFYYKVVGI